MRFKVKIDMPSAAELIQKKGLGPGGRVQMFHTANVSRRIERFMPKQDGALRGKLKRINGTMVEVLGPYAKYQYHGKVMVGRAPKRVTDKPLNYSEGGPHWDKALVAEEGEVMREELQAYINRGG